MKTEVVVSDQPGLIKCAPGLTTAIRFSWISSIVGITLMIFALPLLADELLLKEGKTLSGKIVSESEEEYTIQMRRNMVLRVPKESVAKVTRTDAPSTVISTATSTPSYQIRTVKVSTVSVAPLAPVSHETPSQTKDRTVHGFRISEIFQTEDVLKSKSLHSSWVPSWSAEGGKDENGYRWVSGVVVATITLPSDGLIKEMRQKMLSEALTGFVETLHQLRSNSEVDLKMESDILFNEMKNQTEKRWQGALRRMNSRALPKK